MSQDLPHTPGFYGKLPTLGDFVSRRLPGDFVQPWDLWLRESLAHSRAQLGEGWLDTYLTSPLWRFVLTPGIAGQGAWVGVLMPSVDRVGRYFPLTLACPIDPGADAPRLLVESDWLERAEDVVLAALHESISVEGFDALTLGLGAPAQSRHHVARATTTGQLRTNALRIPLASSARLDGVRVSLLAETLGQLFCAYSCWWSSGSERVAPSLLVCQGLPPTDGFSALLTGDWSGQGWCELDEVADPQPT